MNSIIYNYLNNTSQIILQNEFENPPEADQSGYLGQHKQNSFADYEIKQNPRKNHDLKLNASQNTGTAERHNLMQMGLIGGDAESVYNKVELNTRSNEVNGKLKVEMIPKEVSWSQLDRKFYR